MNWHTHCVNYRQLYLVNQLLWNKGLQGSSVITSPLWIGSYENTVKPPLNSPPPGTCKWLLSGGWPLNMGLSYISIIISRNITLLRNKWAMGEALLVHKRSSTPISNSISFIKFFNWSQTKNIKHLIADSQRWQQCENSHWDGQMVAAPA